MSVNVLFQVLERLKERGVVLNWEKCRLRVTEFDFLGYKINTQGIQPSTLKRDAVTSFRRPSNEKEVRSFLGLANYMGKFISNLADIDESLRKLKKGLNFTGAKQKSRLLTKLKAAWLMPNV